ncbi:MAG: hypothetical protein A4E57_04219 [Syntrophorhabdaceae bacterium PtaU1.Bin034]|nr:MAG: hypothetical protein A4E57_04219 [Syntrophorhabdaceae bacterium PtaU1.Bin034]
MDGVKAGSHLRLKVLDQRIDIVAGERRYAGGNNEDVSRPVPPVDLSYGFFELCLPSAYDIGLIKGRTEPQPVFHGPLPGGVAGLDNGVLRVDA